MQSNMTIMVCGIIKGNDGKLHGNISQNGYGNAIIDRLVAVLRKVYSGCMVPAKVAWYKRG